MSDIGIMPDIISRIFSLIMPDIGIMCGIIGSFMRKEEVLTLLFVFYVIFPIFSVIFALF